MPESVYLFTVAKDIHATENEKLGEKEATGFRYVVDKMYVQIDRHGRSSLFRYK
jgi:hypothetical protein